jgi:hypothetical protein
MICREGRDISYPYASRDLAVHNVDAMAYMTLRPLTTIPSDCGRGAVGDENSSRPSPLDTR